MRRSFLLAAALALLAGCGSTGDVAVPPERLVLVVVDMLRQDHVSAYGGRVETPVLDRLAENGRRFEEAVSSFHMTSMAMGALFTGRTPSLETGTLGSPLPWNGTTWCGFRRFDPTGTTCVPQALTTLAEVVKRAGYTTIGVVSNPLIFNPAGFSRGFDQWVEVGDVGLVKRRGRQQDGNPYIDGAVLMQRLRAGADTSGGVARSADPVLRAVRAALAKRRDDRFFLYVHFMDVHDHVMLQVDYAEGVRRADTAVGKLLDILVEDGLADGTITVVMADHGERLGEQHAVVGPGNHEGNPSFETLLKVPLIVSPAPPMIRELPSTLRGEDVYRLVAALATAAPQPPAADLDDGELLVSEERYVTYRTPRWKSLWPRDGGKPTLFDLDADPAEKTNVSAAHPDVVEAHGARVQALVTKLASEPVPDKPLTDVEKQRLRALGYLE